jgi:adenylosuccinate synthase
MPNIVVIGAQWGDEGKGKIVDLLTARFDLVVRYQGGHNAGHTVWVNGRKIVLHLIPSGIVRPEKHCVIGNGVVVDLDAFWAEVEMLSGMGIQVHGRLLVSDRAHLILPYHRYQERIEEDRRGVHKIGTTCRGIGPAYEDKSGRRGLQVIDLFDAEGFRSRLDNVLEQKRRLLGDADVPELSASRIAGHCLEQAKALREFVAETASFINRQIDAGKQVLFEGAQGLMLDIDHGTYPFVTSSSAGAAGACTGSGVSPRLIHGVLGVAKAYCTRVGAGPFPTELQDTSGDLIRERGNEYGASTGRPRRCGWFDAVALRYAQTLNRFDALVITKLDVLDSFSDIPVCVGYRYKSTPMNVLPSELGVLEKCQPVYENRPGWQQPTQGVREFRQLPGAARDYLQFLEDTVGAEISIISTGADREDTILLPERPGLGMLLSSARE